jgi:predicted AlkP superfamily phosphohydrolase/phosphomutase
MIKNKQISIVVFFFFLIVSGCTQIEKKVLIIGIDGMDPNTTEKLIENGNLPNFKKLRDSGSFLNLNTSNPPQSPVAWASIATGTNPAKHNIFDFIIRNPKTYLPELSIIKNLGGTKYGQNMKGEAFWKISSKNGIPTTVIRWPGSFPPDKIKGNMLSGLGVPDINGRLSGYTYYTQNEIKKDLTSPHKKIQIQIDENNIIKTEIFGPSTKKFGEIIPISTELIIQIFENHIILTVDKKEYEINEDEWSEWIPVKFNYGFGKKINAIFKVNLIETKLFEMYATSLQIDPLKAEVDISSPKSYSNKLAKEMGYYYTLGEPEEIDGFNEGLLPKEAFVSQTEEIINERDFQFKYEFNKFLKKGGVFAFVFDTSDRLQHLFWDSNTIDPVLLKYYKHKDKLLGEILNKIDDDTLLIILSDHGFSKFEKQVEINTWLYQEGYINFDEEISLKDSKPLFQNVDFSKTKAYSVGFNGIYINEKDREKEGIIDKSKKEDLVNEIILKLEKMTDKDGKKPIYKAYRKEEIYSGDYLDNAPDIIIGYNVGYRSGYKSPIGGFHENIISKNEKKWSADHMIDPKFVPGLIFINQPIKQNSVDQKDIAPTILNFLNLDIPGNIDGRNLLK